MRVNKPLNPAASAKPNAAHVATPDAPANSSPDPCRRCAGRTIRPAFRSDLANISLAFLPFKELSEHCDALCKFGDDHTILQKIARSFKSPGTQPKIAS